MEEVMEDYKEEGICSICGLSYTHWGNNAYPVNDGRCCDNCNSTVVVPARLNRIIMRNQNKEEK